MSSPNSKYFKRDKKKTIFMGSKLEIFLPMRYERAGCLSVEGDVVSTLGFFDMVIDGKIKSGNRLAAMVDIYPSEIDTVTKGTQQFQKLTLYKGDVFLGDNNYVKNKGFAYVLFNDMANLGRYFDFIETDDLMTIYDYISDTTGMQFNANHAIFEILNAQLTRDADDISVLYRHTEMRKDPTILGLHNIAQVATSTTAKIAGSYMRGGFESVMANESDNTPSEVENRLRA